MNTPPTLISFIQKIVRMDEQAIEEFAKKATTRKFKKKEIFVREEEVCHSLLFIQKGLFRYFILHEGNDSTKDFAVENINPFCTAFTSFITQSPSQIWIEALEDSTVLEWKDTDVLPLFEKNLHWILFAKKMAEKLFILKEKRELSFLKSTPLERYRAFLKDYPLLNQRIPQFMIASYLGLQPESLSRIRKRLALPSK